MIKTTRNTEGFTSMLIVTFIETTAAYNGSFRNNRVQQFSGMALLNVAESFKDGFYSNSFSTFSGISRLTGMLIATLPKPSLHIMTVLETALYCDFQEWLFQMLLKVSEMGSTATFSLCLVEVQDRH